jgi:hypothetical protein
LPAAAVENDLENGDIFSLYRRQASFTVIGLLLAVTKLISYSMGTISIKDLIDNFI